MTAEYEDFLSPKSLWQKRWEKSWLLSTRKATQQNGVYVVAVKTDATKTVQIKYNTDLYSFRSHFIINFFLTEPKLAHSPVKFPTHSISHFSMNIIMAKTCSTAKVNYAKCQNFSNPPNLPAIRYVLYTWAMDNVNVKCKISRCI